MKKGLLILLCAVLLLACAAGAAEEQQQAAPNVFDLYEVKADSARWLGTAIPVTDGALLTSCACLPENLGDLAITDGSAVWDSILMTIDSTNTAAVLFYSVDENRPVLGAYEIQDGLAAFDPQSNYVQVGDETYSRMYRTIYSATTINWRGEKCLLLSLSGPAKPGSPVISERGELSGMVVAEYAEGTDRVVVYPAAEIRRCLSEAAEQLDTVEVVRSLSLEGFTVTAERNEVTFDWSGVSVPQMEEGEALYLVVADTANDYLTYLEAEKDMTSTTMFLSPGRTFVSGMVISKGTPGELPDQFVTTEIPEAEPLTDHAFRSEVCALIVSEEDPVPLTEVTEEMMRNGNLRFYSCTTYQVTETIQDISLLVTLTDPNGCNYRYMSGWIYDPSYMDHDAWSIQLSETGLLEMLNMNGYPAGTYTLNMYIGGELADSSTFELK